MLHRDEANNILLEKGWLSHTPPSFQQSVIERCNLQHYDQGDTVYSVGDPSGGMFGLLRGGLAISVAPGEREPYVAHFARPGAWFGEAAAITGEPRKVGLMATRETCLLMLPLHAIREITGKDPTTWRLFAMAALSHLDLAMGACDDLMIRDPANRCVAILLRLAGRQHASPADATPVEVDLSQSDIADMANVARTTLNSILRKLEIAGYLELSYRRIRILSPKALRVMLSGETRTRTLATANVMWPG
jgi:CRP/FNR family cyclic AMP-dependent transcriptional regulator